MMKKKPLEMVVSITPRTRVRGGAGMKFPLMHFAKQTGEARPYVEIELGYSERFTVHFDKEALVCCIEDRYTTNKKGKTVERDKRNVFLVRAKDLTTKHLLAVFSYEYDDEVAGSQVQKVTSPLRSFVKSWIMKPAATVLGEVTSPSTGKVTLLQGIEMNLTNSPFHFIKVFKELS